MMEAGDEDMLLALLEVPDKLDEREQKAFPDMLKQLRGGNVTDLSLQQHAWVEKRYKALELDAGEPAANLYSEGKVPDGIPNPGARHYEGMKLPLVPPHRMARALTEKAEVWKSRVVREKR